MSLISLFVLTVDPSVLSYEDWSLREAIDVRCTTVTDDFDFERSQKFSRETALKNVMQLVAKVKDEAPKALNGPCHPATRDRAVHKIDGSGVHRLRCHPA
ncbi:hypothetical protein NLM33_24250 [Bradyrhizobium sp. CCGUVB1N3]|uniref:hypothetical protein n=1 Tax=Bradyrhizobium sp. CCGUVB1N3 TaxID=2949629 RepID=UPI0020B3EEA4|nr:hypothetical protein [Bradyrhizobium sp. CCGUVB1N3]MCP3473428.1 hypothetical protein [Bradyrhizobium sp. CCGUVB1N3]